MITLMFSLQLILCCVSLFDNDIDYDGFDTENMVEMLIIMTTQTLVMLMIMIMIVLKTILALTLTMVVIMVMIVIMMLLMMMVSRENDVNYDDGDKDADDDNEEEDDDNVDVDNMIRAIMMIIMNLFLYFSAASSSLWFNTLNNNLEIEIFFGSLSTTLGNGS